MKRLTIIFITAACICFAYIFSKKQNSNIKEKIDIYPYIKEAQTICKALQITTRKSLHKDGEIVLFPVISDTGRYGGMFVPEGKLYLNNSNNGFDMIYSNPKIYIMKSILTGAQDSSNILRMYKCQSILIHEATHYLDTTRSGVNNCPDNDFKCYVSLPWESNAFIVGAYYFISRAAPEVFEDIMKKDISINRKKKSIIRILRISDKRRAS